MLLEAKDHILTRGVKLAHIKFFILTNDILAEISPCAWVLDHSKLGIST